MENKLYIMNKQTIYFNNQLQTEFPTDLVDKAVKVTNSKINVCNNWAELASLIANSDSESTLLLVHSSLLDRPGTTLNEIIDALNLLVAMIRDSLEIKIGIVVDKACSQSFVQALKKSNAAGIVPSFVTFGFDQCFNTVNKLLDGEQVWDRAYIQPKVRATARHATEYGIRLTARQQDIMTLVAKRGLSNKKIAQVLNISESTVKVHISAILKAYGVRNRTQLALAGSSKGLHA